MFIIAFQNIYSFIFNLIVLNRKEKPSSLILYSIHVYSFHTPGLQGINPPRLRGIGDGDGDGGVIDFPTYFSLLDYFLMFH